MADFTEICSTAHPIKIPVTLHQQLVKAHNGRYKRAGRFYVEVAFSSTEDMNVFHSDLHRISTPIRESKRPEPFVYRVLKFLGVKK